MAGKSSGEMRCGKFHVVIKAVFDRRPGGELGVGPQAEDGGGHDMRAGMPDALQLGHFRAVVESFAFGIHWRRRLIWLLIFVGHKFN